MKKAPIEKQQLTCLDNEKPLWPFGARRENLRRLTAAGQPTVVLCAWNKLSIVALADKEQIRFVRFAPANPTGKVLSAVELSVVELVQKLYICTHLATDDWCFELAPSPREEPTCQHRTVTCCQQTWPRPITVTLSWYSLLLASYLLVAK